MEAAGSVAAASVCAERTVALECSRVVHILLCTQE